MRSILIIEDSLEFQEHLELLLFEAGCCARSARCVHDAFNCLAQESYDAILCDLHLPFILNERIYDYPYSVEVGIRTIHELRESLPGTLIIGMTAALPLDLERLAQEENFVPVLHKPFPREALLQNLGINWDDLPRSSMTVQ